MEISHFPASARCTELVRYSLVIVVAPSRKDDLISALYLLIYLKEGVLPWGTVDCSHINKLQE
jgi:hypothetical protein